MLPEQAWKWLHDNAQFSRFWRFLADDFWPHLGFLAVVGYWGLAWTWRGPAAQVPGVPGNK